MPSVQVCFVSACLAGRFVLVGRACWLGGAVALVARAAAWPKFVDSKACPLSDSEVIFLSLSLSLCLEALANDIEEMTSLVQDYQKLGELNAKYERLVGERDALYEDWHLATPMLMSKSSCKRMCSVYESWCQCSAE